MLYTKEAVQANIRNRAGKRVFYLGKGDRLTSDARDYLNHERIGILDWEKDAPAEFRVLGGGVLAEKPEHMTHLNAEVLAVKTHPRIAFRGAIDLLEAELLLCQSQTDGQLYSLLQEALEQARELVRCDVLEQPVPERSLGGLTQAQLRSHSHRPQEYYNQPHFMPDGKDAKLLLQINKCRCLARSAELAALRAYLDADGQPTRVDILQALNRLSSFLYILMIRIKAGALP